VERLTGHADVLAAIQDPATFSSRVSVHVAVPNGMDAAEHAAFRAVVDRCFTPERVSGFEQELRSIAAAVVAGAPPLEVMTAMAQPFAAAAQCAYLGWGQDAADALLTWSADSQAATRYRDRAELDRVAARFDAIIRTQLDAARSRPDTTLTHALLADTVYDRPLTDSEIVSIVRNWTAGELATIAAAVGIVVEFLARRPDVQQLLREQPGLRQAAMDEMLRIEAPLLANRRRTTCEVEVAGRRIPANAPVTIDWAAAHRDAGVFDVPDEFRLDRDPADNLLYGRGPHYCPGEGLSRLELGVFLDVLLAALAPFHLAAPPVRAVPPAAGFSEVRIAW
jgi:cytochrome P450